MVFGQRASGSEGLRTVGPAGSEIVGFKAFQLSSAAQVFFQFVILSF